MSEIDLKVDLAGIELENPVVLASGTSGYGIELSSLMDLSRVGALILKTVTREPSKGNPAPRIWETAGGMLNSIGLENVGVEALVKQVLPDIADLGIPIFASIAGDTVKSFARLASRIEEAGVVKAVEVNVSCPNVEKGGIQFGSDASGTAAVVSSVRDNCDLPMFVKLSAAVTDIARIAEAAAQAGAAGLSLINTLPGLAIDPVSRKTRLGAVTGGLSGPAIKPVALKSIWDCYQATSLPVIGGGGVCDENDVVEFLLAGSTAVSIGTATFQDPDRAIRIIEGLPEALQRAGADSPLKLVGAMKAM